LRASPVLSGLVDRLQIQGIQRTQALEEGQPDRILFALEIAFHPIPLLR
jgi:hypothetical protein